MSDSLRIKSVSVKGLFNQFDHHIDFNQDERITILHGINGVGKTTLLRMINNLFNFRIYNFNEIPFISFTVNLSNKSQIVVTKKRRKDRNTIDIVIDGEKLNFNTHNIEKFIQRMHWVDKIGDDIFYDRRIDTASSLDAIIDRYEDHFPDEIASKKTEVLSKLGNIPIQFIEASRLLCTEKRGDSFRDREIITHTHTVKIYASELQKRITHAMADYAKKTQELEQTFPFRLLDIPKRYTDEELKNHIEALQNKRQELRDIGLLPETDLAPMNPSSIDTLEAHHAEVMNLYVKDSEEKLDVLESLSKKIKLLLKIINDKFQGKKLHVDEKKGLIIFGKDGEIDLTLLSSGEQHELVMFYDLIFKVEPNTLIMIDEPELSLHVTWQNKFIDELKQIVEQSKFDVLIATHSATIVGNNSHLMVGLGVTE